ncbi:hypothetical protein EDB81DRAFT_358782 [Dactylonectria macrodidyma]|uniref:Zn(2)-C6 fungal-type domain-containing protein n=1 Tax=Dactylonectria macrodidyma TaxID=307937 RepID=A0A9P9D386_9HYPO|nr:hypothetical protein EDB81DRAFT_358782 [Dactylonectria macrodidyma]
MVSPFLSLDTWDFPFTSSSTLGDAEADTLAMIDPSLLLDPDTCGCSSTPNSGPSSPATVDVVWPIALDPTCRSPRYAWPDCCEHHQLAQCDLLSKDIPPPEETITPSLSITGPRWQGSEDESPRSHGPYKNATPFEDGFYYGPWEGAEGCNHKPTKLKRDYDKFVDSHLEPYRCKAESCEGAQFSAKTCLPHNEREAHSLHGHGEKLSLCTYQGCERAVLGNGFPHHWNLRDQRKRVHQGHATSHFLEPISGGEDTVRTVTEIERRNNPGHPVEEESALPQDHKLLGVDMVQGDKASSTNSDENEGGLSFQTAASLLPVSQSKKGKRMAQACLGCRARKVRCDVTLRQGEACSNCQLDKQECIIKARNSRSNAESGRTTILKHSIVRCRPNKPSILTLF